METLLDVKDLTMIFGGLKALNQVSCSVMKGEILALIGPNGAGKTTLFNCVTGVNVPTKGDVYLFEENGDRKRLTQHGPDKIVAEGLARTFQNIRLFGNMTVLENIMVGRHTHLHSGVLGAIFRPKRTREEEEKVVHDSYEILKAFHLESYVNDLAASLSYGEQRRLEIARAMATDPCLLLLDEPAAGLNPKETRALDELILQTRERTQITILLIEHDMRLVMSLSERIYVMDYGKIIAEGSPEEIRHDPVVIQAYLGDEVDA